VALLALNASKATFTASEPAPAGFAGWDGQVRGVVAAAAAGRLKPGERADRWAGTRT
jgi:hypothetical protein